MPDTNDNWDKLFEQLPLDATPGEGHRIELRARVLEQFDSQSPSPVTTSRLNQTGRILMKYKVPHWTAAAAALIICVVWISQSYSPALAAEDVVAHIMKARRAGSTLALFCPTMSKAVPWAGVVMGKGSPLKTETPM